MSVRTIAIPVKSLFRAKSRLGSMLSPLERAALTLAMMEDVLDATLSVPGWETWVVSPDEAVLEVAARRGATPMLEAKPPLSSALRQAESEAEDRGIGALAVVLADLPLLTTQDLVPALRTLGPVVAAPSRADGGTNFLLRRPPRAIPSRFGRDSFRKHGEAARIRHLPVATVESPGLMFDLDVPDDITTVIQSDRDGRTRTACLELDVAARLQART
jgi:2-phospho-L-lactate/phosphoenolpyruvate guanylyltransferase